MKRLLLGAAAGLAAAEVLTHSTPAVAAACAAYPNPVYVAGSSASQPILQALAGTLAANHINVSIIYQQPDSCVGYGELLRHVGDGTQANYVNGAAATIDACDSDPTPASIDIAVSDVYAQTCVANGYPSLPSGVAEILGPIQAMTFAAPLASAAQVISAEAAYVVFGYDANPPVGPWTVPGEIFTRPSSSGTLNMIGSAIGLVGSKWANSAGATADAGAPPQYQAKTSSMQAALAAASNAAAAIGILSDEAVVQYNSDPANTLKLKVLAYQHKGQSCGYFPDSTPTATDKINVRQGRYAIWGPLHFYVNVDASQAPLGADMDPTNGRKIEAIKTILNYFIATGPTPDATFADDAGAVIDPETKKALIGAEIGDSTFTAKNRAYVVPWCAMEVMRTEEIGAEASFQAPEPCGCYFDSLSTGAVLESHCTVCFADSDCTAAPYKTCRFGYCEAQ